MKVLTNKEMPWEYVAQPPLNTKVLLLTKDNQCLVGPWRGDPLPENKTFKAWQGLPDRDKALEQQLGYR